MTVSTILEPLAEVTARARQAQRLWQEQSVRQRLRVVRRLRHLLVEDADRLGEAVRQDVDKTTGETLATEILPFADACRFLERSAPSLLAPRRIPGRSRPLWFFGQSDVVHRRPRGVVGIIGTWNYPVYLNGVQLIQTLAAGNAVVWKPSEVAPASAQVLTELLTRAGLPEGLLHTLPATREGGPLLLESEIDHLVFTGGVPAGKSIAGRLGQRLISSTMELSGHDALFLLPDGDVKLAADATWFGCTLNRGQTCVAVRRVFVPRGLYPEFLRLLEPAARQATPMRLALASQVRQAADLVTDALQRGGRLLGGDVSPIGDDPRLFRPSIVVDAQGDMDLTREATFAPLTAVFPYDQVEDALALDARCPFGLGGAIFSAQRTVAESLAARLRTGFVTINDVIVASAHPATPFGGLGESGWGVTQGAEGLLDMTVPQVISFRSGTFRPHFDLGQGRQANPELSRGLLQMLHGSTFGQRWRGLWRTIRAARQAGKSSSKVDDARN